ncbi:MAG: hypothetical protein JGK21_06460 [Microcoleus sp. PH2017_22_RUC_O_B]|uniref:hypothetical protein n=1 Tax=unclassified Microcoleus TaxID=2642155 RepID=UPI001DF2C743|nr:MULTISPECIES: hypothetical protein [unclassified Microcoleus]MCC3527992.1 hypothetical protein [Microcoleus sp. PH2017_21_RUC_O_A]MCC3540022.1 hypothetical protein [Microcoleus sp. PH2017_22_RUC_O_B]
MAAGIWARTFGGAVGASARAKKRESAIVFEGSANDKLAFLKRFLALILVNRGISDYCQVKFL